MLATLYLIPVFDLYDLTYVKGGATLASRIVAISITDLVL
jgi:hypothetical protein